MGTDARDLPCAWKTGSGGKCCWLLLPTTVRLGFRAAGEQEGCLARTKEVNYYLPGTHRVWNLLSAIDALVQGKGMWNRTPTKKEIVANLNCPSSLLLLLFNPSPILVLQEDPSPALPVLRKQTVREKTPWSLYFVEKADLSPQAGNSPWMKDTLRLRAVHLAAAQGAVSGFLMRSLQRDNIYELDQ